MNYSLIFNLKNTFLKNNFLKKISFILTSRHWLNVELKKADLVIFFGGDGLLLENLNKIIALNKNIKFLLIKMSKIAFYYQFNFHDFENIIDKYENNHLKIFKLPLLTITNNNKQFYALNEIKIVNLIKPITFKINLNQKLLGTFKSSGLLATSFYGASGFAKTFNGPLFLTKTNLLWALKIIFPVNNVGIYTINNFFIIDSKQELTFESTSFQDFDLIFDNNFLKLNDNKIIINYHQKFINLIVEEDFDLLTKYQNIYLNQ